MIVRLGIQVSVRGIAEEGVLEAMFVKNGDERRLLEDPTGSRIVIRNTLSLHGVLGRLERACVAITLVNCFGTSINRQLDGTNH